jgi:hypothetical protein
MPGFPQDTRVGSSGAPSYILTGNSTKSASLTFPIPSSGAANKNFKFNMVVMGNGSYSTDIAPVVEIAEELIGDDTEWTTLTTTGVPQTDSTWGTVEASIEGTSDFTYIRVSNSTTATDSIQIWIDDITLEGSITLSESVDVKGQDDLDVVCVGGTLQMLLNQTPASASAVGKWYTSDSTGAIDNSGVLTGMYHADTIWVYGETMDGSGLIDSVKIIVQEDAILSESVVVTADVDTVSKNEPYVQMYGVVKPVNVFNKDVTWSVDDQTLAAIDSDGKLRGLADGTVTVTATAADDNKATGTYEITVTGFSSSGLTNSKVEKIGLYPNPVKEVLNLDINTGIQSISVLTLDGRAIIVDNSSETTLDVSNLRAGIYIINVTDVSNKVYISRFVKE